MISFRRISIMLLLVITLFSSVSFAGITEQQGDDVAAFAKKFIEEGNARKDEKGFPLLTYNLTGSGAKNIQIRTNGYNGVLTTVKNSGYYISGGRYLDLGDKWAMDCGTTVLFLLKNTLGLELLNGYGEPWHVIDVYNDAARGENSQYFELVYRSVQVGSIDYSKLRKGDVIGYYTGHGNHGMLYLGDGYIAHANRDMIKSWGDEKVSGFQVGKLNKYFLPGTYVRVMRIKDGIIPEDLVVNGFVTWPDTGETVDLLERPVVEEVVEPEEEEVITVEVEIDEPLLIVTDLREQAEQRIEEQMENGVLKTAVNVVKENKKYYGRFQKLWEQYVKAQLDQGTLDA